MPRPQDRAEWEAHLAAKGFAIDGGTSPSPKRRSQPERAHHRALVRAASLRWWRPYLMHVPNEAVSPQDHAIRRGTAIAPGFPDLLLWLPRPPHPFAALELKPSQGGSVDPAQEAWLALLALCGGAICHAFDGWPEALAALDSYAGERRPGDPPPPHPDGLAALGLALARRGLPDHVSGEGVGAGDGDCARGGGDPLSRQSTLPEVSRET